MILRGRYFLGLMPAAFFLDTQRGIVFSKAVGVFGRPEALDHMDRLLGDADFRPEFNQLFDFREVTTVALSTEDARELATRTIFNARSRRAFVVSDVLSFGIGRVFATYREIEGERGIVMFKEMGDALAWLELSVEPDPGLFARLNAPADVA